MEESKKIREGVKLILSIGFGIAYITYACFGIYDLIKYGGVNSNTLFYLTVCGVAHLSNRIN